MASALATVQLKLSDGTTTVTVTDGGLNDGLPNPGAVLYNGPVGSNWTINVSVAITKPQVGTANQPLLELHTQNISQQAGKLTIWFTESNYTGGATFDAQAGGNTDGSVELKFYADTSNVPFGTGKLLADLPGLTGNFAADSNGVANITGTFSLTLEADITHTGPGTTTFDQQLTLNPPQVQPPLIQCRGDRNLDCNPELIPGCDTNSVTIIATAGVSNVTCAVAGPDIVTGCVHERDLVYTVIDTAGQSASCTQHIFWTADKTPPTFTTCPTNIDLGCNPTGDIPGCDTSKVAATDDCGRTVITCTNLDSAIGCNHTRTIIYTATDFCGNKATCTQLITWVVDTTPPSITCPNNLSLKPDSHIPDANTADVKSSDDCSTPTIAYLGAVTNGDCPTIITRTYQATDACGNKTSCSQTITIECHVGGCRVTGGSNKQTNSYQSDCITTPLPTNLSHGGQVGAAFTVETPFSPNNPCISGEWQHNRHLNGNSLVGVLHASGNGNEHQFDSLLCACLPCPENPGAIGVVGETCNPGDRVCGPEPRRAPANKICFSGVGDYTFTQGNKTVKAVFRVDISDHGEGNSPANPAPLDRYRIRIWVLDPACGRNPDPNSSEAMAIRYAASADPNQIAVLATTENLKVNIQPDIDDGGNMTQGNHQIHPETGATCKYLIPALAPARVDVQTSIAPLVSGASCNFGITAKGYQGAQNPQFVYKTTVTNCGSVTLSNLSVINTTGTATDNTALYFAPGAKLAPGQSVTRYYTNTCASDTANTVIVTGTSVGDGSPTFASSCAMASVVPASISCTVALSSTGDLDGAVDSHLTLAAASTASVTESLTVCNTGSCPITGIQITDGLLGLVLPTFDLAPGACTTVSGTKSLACPASLTTRSISISGNLGCDCTKNGSTPATIPVTVSSTVSYEPQKAGPTGLTVSTGKIKSNSADSLTWNALTGATSYNVKRATSASGPFTKIASGVTSASYTDTPVTSNITYYYTVSAIVTGAETANSAVVSVKAK